MPHRILAEMTDRMFNHVIAVPVASIGVIAPHVDTSVQMVHEIVSAPLSNYASVASAIYLTMMIIKTLYDFYVTWRNKK
jgi:hypothetical protein